MIMIARTVIFDKKKYNKVRDFGLTLQISIQEMYSRVLCEG